MAKAIYHRSIREEKTDRNSRARGKKESELSSFRCLYLDALFSEVATEHAYIERKQFHKSTHASKSTKNGKEETRANGSYMNMSTAHNEDFTNDLR